MYTELLSRQILFENIFLKTFSSIHRMEIKNPDVKAGATFCLGIGVNSLRSVQRDLLYLLYQ
jgi:hypothetical protein